ncbi:hypothetical protein SLS56_000518 [Neofusicoccum ribis]|uniref:Uncharacterized protein n=1 Tax=Neofusicoccum ribis TaxID=45134 RepID=A0ABR3TD05_9PEZI
MVASGARVILGRLINKNTRSIEQHQDENKLLSAAFDELRNDNAHPKVFQDQTPSLIQLEVRQAMGHMKEQMMSSTAKRNHTDQAEKHDGTRHIHGITVENAVAGRSTFDSEGDDKQPIPTNMLTHETLKRNYDARSPVTDMERRKWASMWISEKMRVPLNDYIHEKGSELKRSEKTPIKYSFPSKNDKKLKVRIPSISQAVKKGIDCLSILLDSFKPMREKKREN